MSGWQWDAHDDQEVQSHRVSARWQKAMQFLDSAVETTTAESQEADCVSLKDELKGEE